MQKNNGTLDATIISKVNQFEARYLNMIDEVLLRGGGCVECLKVLSLNYKGMLAIPTRAVMDLYIKKRKKVLRVDEILLARSAVANLLPTPSMRMLDTTDKRAILDAVLKILMERVEAIRRVQPTLMDPRFETILTNDLATIRDTIVEQVKIDTKMGFDRSRLQGVVKVLLSHISNAIVQSYRDVHSDEALGAFTKSLQGRLDTLAFDVIESDVQASITTVDLPGKMEKP